MEQLSSDIGDINDHLTAVEVNKQKFSQSSDSINASLKLFEAQWSVFVYLVFGFVCNMFHTVSMKQENNLNLSKMLIVLVINIYYNIGDKLP